jgi:transposase-like protein
MLAQDRNAAVGAVEALFIPRPLDQLCCVNPACPLAGIYAGENLSVCPSKGSGRYRILRCGVCKKEFSERKGTAMWGSRMAEDKAISIAQHLQEGCGIRQTARLVGVSKDGVTSVAIRLGLHSKRLHDQEVKNLVVTEVQFDEKWSFVEKKRETLRPRRSG